MVDCFILKNNRYLNFPGQTWFEYLCDQNPPKNILFVCGGHTNVTNLRVLCRFSAHISLRTMIAANQIRRSSRIRNRELPPLSPNQKTTHRIVFTPKLKYINSFVNDEGVLILSKRKRSPPTADEIERRKQKKRNIQIAKVSLVALRHEVVSIWQHGMYKDNFQFGPQNTTKIIGWMQATYPEQYSKKAAAKSFVYRALKRYKERLENPHLEPHRDRRGENRRKTKREDPRVVELCDELLSEPKATAPKVQRGLRNNGITVSLSTIYRVAKDLLFRWQKPWHTDVLTPAQKLKRKLFCTRLLRLSEPDLLRELTQWMFTDEKWWDLVGPAAYKYVKATTNMEAKLQNQVCFLFICLPFIRLSFYLIFFQVPRNKSKKGGMKRRVYFWGGICWWCKTPGVAWCASDLKVTFRHTKNICHGTVFEEEDDDDNPCVYRVVETLAAGDDNNVSYVAHFAFPDADPPQEE